MVGYRVVKICPQICSLWCQILPPRSLPAPQFPPSAPELVPPSSQTTCHLVFVTLDQIALGESVHLHIRPKTSCHLSLTPAFNQ